MTWINPCRRRWNDYDNFAMGFAWQILGQILGWAWEEQVRL